MRVRLFNHFGSQVVESPTVGLPFGMRLVHKIRPTKICQFHVTFLVDQNIFGLDVPMNDIVLVDIAKSFYNLVDVLGTYFLAKPVVGLGHHVLVKFSLVGELQDKVHRKLILEVIIKLDDIRVI
jgi:hypothetical protein